MNTQQTFEQLKEFKLYGMAGCHTFISMTPINRPRNNRIVAGDDYFKVARRKMVYIHA
jgi:hypothetical protein